MDPKIEAQKISSQYGWVYEKYLLLNITIKGEKRGETLGTCQKPTPKSTLEGR